MTRFAPDVGGGNETNDNRTTLANPSLRWMVHEILESRCRILFRHEAFLGWLPSLNDKIWLHKDTALSATVPVVNKSLSDSEGDDELKINGQESPETPRFSSFIVDKASEGSQDKDAQAEPHDMLKDKPLWWILEVFPLYQYWFDRKELASKKGYT